MHGSPQPDAGWFPDPHAPTTSLRWWDGAQWTEHVSPVPVAHNPAPVLRVASLPTTVAPVSTPLPSADSSAGQPARATTAAERHTAGGRFDIDRFVVRQRLRPLVNKYDVFEAKDGPDKHPADGKFVVRVQQRRIALRERIDFKDESDSKFMHLQSRKVLDAHGRTELLDATGTRIGTLHKQFTASLVQSTWHLLGPDDEHLVTVKESSVLLALWRRFVGLVPYIGELLHLIPIPYGFTLTAGPAAHDRGLRFNSEIGTYNRRLGLFDTYDMDLRRDPERVLDRRLAVALAIALDALQGR